MADIAYYLEDFKRIEDSAGRDARVLLETTRNDILAEIASRPSENRVYQLDEILSAVEHRISMLRYDYINTLENAVAAITRVGIVLGMAPLPSPSTSSLIGISPQLIRGLVSYRADRIKGLTDEIYDKISDVIRRGVLTGKSSDEITDQLGSVIRDRGTFGALNTRATFVFNTEVHRAAEMATQEGLNETGKALPTLRKRWLATLYHTRQWHIEANGQEVPYNEPFTVGGEKMMYPLDPAGSAKNVVNCMCVCIPVVPGANNGAS